VGLHRADAWLVDIEELFMTKDEALDLALEALECFDYPAHDDDVNKIQAAITAIKQVRALDKKAENGRELGLDYEPN